MLEIISYIASGLIMTLTPILFVKIVLHENIKTSKLETILIIIIFLISYMLSQAYLTGLLKTIINCTFHVILIKRLYSLDYWSTILLIVAYVLLMIIIDALELVCFIYIFKIPKDICYEHYAGSLLSNIIITSTCLLTTYISKNKIRKLLNHKLNASKKLSILSFLTLICILFLFYKSFSNIKIDDNFYINICIIIAFAGILFSLVYQIIVNNKQEIEYDKLLEFMKTYEVEIEKERIQRHETKNQLLTIKSKIYDKEKDYKVINYIDSILDEKIEVSQEHYAKFQYLPANGLKALFYFKTKEAENKNIKVSINISKKVENSILYNLSTNEFKQLGRLIGIYLDNAIEGSIESDDKKLGIEIYVISNDVEIIISNTYGRISTNNKSTKGKNRGHGLLLANNILNSTNKFTSKKEITDKLYIQKLIIKKSTK